MNPKIKEALSNSIQKDAETEKICTFIANFIKEYEYYLNHNNIIKINCRFFCNGGTLNITRTNYITSKGYVIELYVPNTEISEEIVTTLNKTAFIELLKKEGAHVKAPSNSNLVSILEIQFDKS